MSKYVDILSIHEHFPDGIEVPHRLLELLEWFDTTIKDEMGWFPEFTGSSLDWYCQPADISPYFGTFNCLGDGSILAHWFYEGCNIENSPIVILGSEGDCGIVSASIEGFVSRLIRGDFPSKAAWSPRLVNFYLHPDYSWIEKLETWAIQRWGLTPQIVQELISSSPEEVTVPGSSITRKESGSQASLQ
jgi:hypothetical protein